MKRIILVFLILIAFFTAFGMGANSVNDSKKDNKTITYNSQSPTLPTEENAIEIPDETVSLIQKENIKRLDDVLFIGNSLIKGIELTTEGDDFIAESGATLKSMRNGGSYNIIEELHFDVVIVGFGTNELADISKAKMSEEINELCKRIYQKNEDAVVVLLSVPPVSQWKSDEDKIFNNENVQKMNSILKVIVKEQNLCYIDNTEFFGDVLQNDLTTDGIHFNGYIYQDWHTFILEKIKEIEKSQAS